MKYNLYNNNGEFIDQVEIIDDISNNEATEEGLYLTKDYYDDRRDVELWNGEKFEEYRAGVVAEPVLTKNDAIELARDYWNDRKPSDCDLGGEVEEVLGIVRDYGHGKVYEERLDASEIRRKVDELVKSLDDELPCES